MAHLIRALRGTEACRGAEGARADERSYLAHERTVMAMLASRHRDLDPDSRYEIYHEAWASVLERRAEGVEIEHLEGYLLCAADRLASKRVHGADARRRITFDPVESPFASVADPAQSPEEAVLAADEARRVRMLIDELEGSERALAGALVHLAHERATLALNQASRSDGADIRRIEAHFREQRLRRSVTIPRDDRLRTMLDTATYSLGGLDRSSRLPVKLLGLAVAEQLV